MQQKGVVIVVWRVWPWYGMQGVAQKATPTANLIVLSILQRFGSLSHQKLQCIHIVDDSSPVDCCPPCVCVCVCVCCVCVVCVLCVMCVCCVCCVLCVVSVCIIYSRTHVHTMHP